MYEFQEQLELYMFYLFIYAFGLRNHGFFVYINKNDTIAVDNEIIPMIF